MVVKIPFNDHIGKFEVSVRKRCSRPSRLEKRLARRAGSA